MKIVLLFFCAILIFIIILILLLISLTIKLNIEDISINNFEKGIKKKGLDKKFLVYLEFYLFGKIKIAKMQLKRTMLKKLNLKNDVKKDLKSLNNVNVIELIKKLKIKYEKIDFNVQIGTEDIFLTVFLVTFISAVFGILLKVSKPKEVEYIVMPLYQFGNVVNFKLNCIINVKMVHIIYVIYILFKKGMMKNERTPNRRAYDYSYE